MTIVDTDIKMNNVVVFPYRRIDDKFQFLVRDELVFEWAAFPVRCAITLSGEREPERLCIVSLRSIAGYKIKKKDLIDLGTLRESKRSASVYNLYSVDLTSLERTMPKKVHNSFDECVWIDFVDSDDAFVLAAYTRLIRKLKEMVKNGKRITR